MYLQSFEISKTSRVNTAVVSRFCWYLGYCSVALWVFYHYNGFGHSPRRVSTHDLCNFPTRRKVVKFRWDTRIIQTILYWEFWKYMGWKGRERQRGYGPKGETTWIWSTYKCVDGHWWFGNKMSIYKIKFGNYSLLHLERQYHFFFLKSSLLIVLSMSFLPRPIKKNQW